MTKGTVVFVYGTLLRGEPNHPLLAGSEFLGPAVTVPEFTLVDLGAFPGLIAGGDTAVQGELFSVDKPTLAALDQLEGHPRFYRRSPITLSDGQKVLGYVLPVQYLTRGDRIPGGDWRLYRRSFTEVR